MDIEEVHDGGKGTHWAVMTIKKKYSCKQEEFAMNSGSYHHKERML